MGLFGDSFEEKVAKAVEQVLTKVHGLQGLNAKIDGKQVTLTGHAPDMETKTRAVTEFNALVETENTFNRIEVPKPAPAPAAAAVATATATPVTPTAGPAESAGERVHTVVSGDTLSGLAQHYYGKASLYMKIFEANRDQLKNPDLIKVGQKLRIPQ